ncbi:MAG: hypothetical protein IPN71_05855 [Fibrobacteres bacterium]|nr:hypothetical protein [Fibrobacterota bacterium]
MTLAVLLAVCASIVSSAPTSKTKAATYQAVVPEGNLTAITVPLDPELLAFPDAPGVHPIQAHVIRYDDGADVLLVIQGKVASRRQRLEGLSRDTLAATQRFLLERIQTEMDVRVVQSLDTLYDAQEVRWTRHESWRWTDRRGTVELETFQPIHDTTGNGRLFERMDSLVRTVPSDTLIARTAKALAESYRDASDTSAVVRISSWNRLANHAFGDALSACIQTHRCDRFPGLERDSVGADSLWVLVDSVPDHWLPVAVDTSSRESDYGDESTHLWGVERLGTGPLDSLSEFETVWHRMDEGQWPRLQDSLRKWEIEKRGDFFQTLQSNLDSSVSPSTRERVQDLGAIAWDRSLPTIRRGMQASVLSLVPSNSILVRRRPIAVPWPLEERDVTQRFRPRPALRTRDRVLPWRKSIESVRIDAAPCTEVVLFVAGKVQQRRMILEHRAIPGSDSRGFVDSAFQFDLQELRSVFGQEQEIRRDTSEVANIEGGAMVVETRIWKPEGGEVKIRRTTPFSDTVEGLAMLERAVRKLSLAEPGLDSSRLRELADEFRERIVEMAAGPGFHEIILSNALEPDRFLQAMTGCLEDSSCEPFFGHGVGKDSDGRMVADSYKIPLAWFPEEGRRVHSIAWLPDTSIPLQVRSDTLRGQFEKGMEFERTSRNLVVSDFRLFVAQMTDLLKTKLEASKTTDEVLSPLVPYLLEESGDFFGRMALALARAGTLSQELVVRRRSDARRPGN